MDKPKHMTEKKTKNDGKEHSAAGGTNHDHDIKNGDDRFSAEDRQTGSCCCSGSREKSRTQC